MGRKARIKIKKKKKPKAPIKEESDSDEIQYSQSSSEEVDEVKFEEEVGEVSDDLLDSDFGEENV